VKNMSKMKAVDLVTQSVKETLRMIIDAVNWGANVGCKALLALLVTAGDSLEEFIRFKGEFFWFMFYLYNCCVFNSVSFFNSITMLDLFINCTYMSSIEDIV
jgi:hypothetical protein